MPEKQKIGIDVDEVVVEFVRGFLKFYNEEFEKDITFKDIYVYDLWKPLKITKEEQIDLVYKFYNLKDFSKLELVKGAKEGIKDLSKKYHLFFITSRPRSVREKTESYLKKYFPEEQFKVIFSGDFFGGGKPKSEICSEAGIEVMIEDNVNYAFECAEKGVKVFLLDKPWNKESENHENIIRIKNWEELLNKLEI